MSDLIRRQEAIDAIEYWHGIDASEALERLPAVGIWIPVTERLPEKTGKYLVSVKNGNVYAGTFSAYEGAFNCAATAWMELPEPYKEPEDPSHPCADSVMMGE